MKKQVHVNRDSLAVKAVIIGFAVMLVILIILTGVLSFLLVGSNIREENGRFAQMVIHTLSVLIGCLVAFWVRKEKMLLSAMILSATYSVVLTICNIAAFGANYQSILPNIVAIVAGMVASCLLCGMKRTVGTKKYHRQKW